MIEMMVELVQDIFPLIFLLFTSYFSLSFDFSPSSFLLLLLFFFFFTFLKNDIRIWRSFWILKRLCNKCEV